MMKHNLTEYSDQDWLSGSRRPARLCMTAAPEDNRHSGHTKAKAILASLLLIAALLFIALPKAWAVSEGTVITNSALATYGEGTIPDKESPSNIVTTVTTVIRTPSIVKFLRYIPEHPDAEQVNIDPTDLSTSGNDAGPFVTLPPPVPFGETDPVVLNSPVPLIPAEVYHVGEPFFLRLTDLDQNLDNLVRETVLLTLTVEESGIVKDTELIRLTETGPGTGIFAGYIPSDGDTSASHNNGSLTVTMDSNINASYIDVIDGSDTSADAALIDPFGIVFDSSTGLPINGALVSIIDTGTGFPAAVFCEDGSTPYPSENLETGGGVFGVCDIDYDFPDGGFRFPFMNPGNYRIEVTPIAGYAYPSSVPTAVLQSLPGAPFTIVNGSRREAFDLLPGPALEIDIPLDPSSSGLWLSKSVSKDVAAIGDFLQYTLELENRTISTILGVDIIDMLPLGFRYQAGSLKIDSEESADPEISENGRQLTIPVGDMEAYSTVSITYVVEVSSGAKLGRSTNTAVAGSLSGFTSYIAHATVVIKEDLFRNKSFIIGRVIADNCEDEPMEENDGVSGIRIYLEDGTYILTDEEGKYHFEGIEPGVHVVQLDIESLPEEYWIVPCEENTRYAGRSFSQFVDLQGGTMWRADFHLALKPAMLLEIEGEAAIELKSTLTDTECEAQNDRCSSMVDYEVLLRSANLPLQNLRLSVILPDGLNYVKGSSHHGDTALEDPFEIDNALTYRLGDVEADWEGTIKLSADIPYGKDEEEFTTKALLTFDTDKAKNNRTPLADNILTRVISGENITLPPIDLHPHFLSGSAVLSSEDKMRLDGVVKKLNTLKIESIHFTGHTDSQRISNRLISTFADNYKLSFVRARSVARYMSKHMDLSPDQIIIDGKGPDEPVAGNDTSEGMARNRRVELNIIAEQSSTWHEVINTKDSSGEKVVELDGIMPSRESKAVDEKDKEIEKETIPEFNWMWMNNAETGLDFVWPPNGYYPPIPSIKAAIKHNPGKELVLLLNGEGVDPLYLDGTTKRDDNRVAVTLWIGIHLEEGDNLLEAVEYDQDGTESRRISKQIHYSSSPVKAELVPERSRLVADGLTPAVIAVRLTDNTGHPAREGVVGEYSVDPPYSSLTKIEELNENPLMSLNGEISNYLIGDDGVALIELMPTSQTGEVALRFSLVEGEDIVTAWLTPETREWILVGLAEGTLGYNTLSGNMENLDDSDIRDELYEDGRVAFFAKGTIKGEWLLTLAYDSEKERKDGSDSLFGTIDPDSYYTLYGDTANQQYDSASAEKLYVKLERNQFYALFGDFNTGLNVTELSRYNRSFTGLKTELQTERFSLNLFATETDQAFIKKEIRGDGTSGLYHLFDDDDPNKNIVLNSENVVIETRDRFRTEVILETRALSRHIDYSIDYDSGTIFFKEPVFSKDENMNPIYIVIDFELNDPNGSNEYSYGGRGAVRLLNNMLETGATYIHEGGSGSEGDLYGADATLDITENTTIKAEYSSTESTDKGVKVNGDAYLAEIKHNSENLYGTVYYREQEGGFGLDQQNESEGGTRKYGAEASYSINDWLTVNALAYRQQDLADDHDRDVGELSTEYTADTYKVRGGLRHAEETLDDGTTNSTLQATAGASKTMMDGRLTLRADREQSLGSDNENADFPTRTIFGSDYIINNYVTVFGEHEFTNGDDIDTQNSRAGITSVPWSGGTTVSSLTRQYDKDGTRVFATMGLSQAWQYDKWSFNGGFDHSRMIKKTESESIPSFLGISTNDFTAFSLGTTYSEEKWSWDWRGEARYSDIEDKYGLHTAIYGEVRKGLGMSAGLHLFTTETESGYETLDANLRLGLAHRPRNTEWIILDRLDFYYLEETGPDQNYESWKIVNNMNANYKPNIRNQVSFQYGAKYVKDTFDGTSYSGFTDLIGVEARHDITKRWDIGARGSLLHSWNSNQYDYSAGLSVGCNIMTNAWVSLGYNFTGFVDEDFSSAKYTAQGPFIQFRMKFDQNSIKDIVKRNSDIE